MEHSRADVRGKAKPGLDIRFEPQSLTSYSELIVFQHLFSLVGVKERLWRCFRYLKDNPNETILLSKFGFRLRIFMISWHYIGQSPPTP